MLFWGTAGGYGAQNNCFTTCQLPSERDLPFSRLSHADIAREAVRNDIVASISGATVWR